MTFAEKIVRLRKIKGLSQDELASAVGVSRQAVYKWESGQSYPEVPKLLELKLIFGISIDDLLDETYEVILPEKKRKKRLSRSVAREIEESVRRELEKEKAAATADDVIAVPTEDIRDAEVLTAKSKNEEITAPVSDFDASESKQTDAAQDFGSPEQERDTEDKSAKTAEESAPSPDEKASTTTSVPEEKEKRTFFGRLFGRK